MTVRELPPAEWPRLHETELAAVVSSLSPTFAKVLAVEDEYGELVGCWALVSVFHAEGIWIRPDHRGKTSVARRLLAGMRRLLWTLNAAGVITASVDGAVDDMLVRLDAVALPGRHYYLPFRNERTH